MLVGRPGRRSDWMEAMRGAERARYLIEGLTKGVGGNAEEELGGKGGGELLDKGVDFIEGQG